MEALQCQLYSKTWHVIFNQLQDTIFFTRPEVFPMNLSTNSELKLFLSWKTCHNTWEQDEFHMKFDKQFSAKLPDYF